MPFATTHETCAINLAVLNGQVFVSMCELTRLNMDTCKSVFASAGLHWENVLRAQTPEQFVTRQADTLPWLAMQIAGYTRGWMDIASQTAANLSRCASDRHDGHARQVGTTLDGMARCAQGVDAMMRALNPATQLLANSQVCVSADLDRASEAAATTKRQTSSAERRQTSR
jgi:phasin family protein